MTYVVGLTGGIGSGKSTVAGLFANLNIPVISADQLARDVVKPGSPALKRIIQHFGTNAISPDGELDRTWLRQRIFQNSSDRQWLEDLLHPLIANERQAQIETATAPYVVVEIPLLLEKQLTDEVDRVLVVDSTEAQQKSRALARDGVTEKSVEAVMNTQIGRAERCSRADDLVDNSGPLDSLRSQIEALHQKYLDLSAATR